MSELSITQMSPSEFLSLFNRVIDSCRNILRTDGITGMDSMKHLTLYILARVLSVEECKRLSISEKFSWDKFMELLKQDKKQEAFNLFFCKNGAEPDLIGALDEKFNTKNFNYKLNKIELHASILKELNKIDLNNLDGHVDILGTVYENHLGSGSNKSAMRDLGQFFTDRKVCNYMVNLCQPKLLADKRAESVLDPTMGTGGFLTSYVKYLKANGHTIDWSKMQDDVVGCDIDEFVVSIGEINMYLSTGVLFDRISHRDSLQNDVGEPDQRLKFKIILANEPFGVKGLKFADSCKRVKDLGINGTKSEPLFLNLMMAALDKDGRCAVVVPDGVLVNNSNQHNGTRKYLLDNFELKRVIKMKGQFFSNTGIQPSILFFENTGCPTSLVEFWEVEQDSDGGIIEKMVLSVPRSKFDDACSLDMRRYQEVAPVVNTGGFETLPLGDLFEVKGGKAISKVNLIGTLYPYYGCNGINGYVDEFIYDGEYIVCAQDGSIGSIYLLNEKFYPSNHTHILKTKNETKIINSYGAYFLKMMVDWKSLITSIIPKVTQSNLLEIKIIIPPLAIQQEIVTALDLIYNNAATAKAAAASVKSQMAAVVRSVGARGFERKKLGDICEFNTNISKHDTHYGKETGLRPFYTGAANNKLFTDTPDIHHPVIIMNRTNGAGKCNLFIDTECAVAGQAMVFYMKDKDEKSLQYLYHYLITFKTRVEEGYVGSNHKNISNGFMEAFEVEFPPLPIQHEVLAILNEMEAELQTLEQMAAKAEQRAKFILDGYLTPAPQAEPVAENVMVTSLQAEEKPVKKRVFKVVTGPV